MRLLIPALLLVALSLAAVQASEVYRTVDERGQVIYSDRPLSPASVRVSVDARPSGPAQAEDSGAQPPAAAEARRPSPRDEDVDPAVAEQRELRAKACSDARRNLAAYENAPRLFEELPGGGRRFLSDEETARVRAEAREAVLLFCDE